MVHHLLHNLPRLPMPPNGFRDREGDIGQPDQHLLPGQSHHDEEDLRPPLPSKSRIAGLAWLTAIITTCLLTLTSLYASDVLVASPLRLIYSSSSNTIFVLSVLSSLTGLLLAATIAMTFEQLQWLLISRDGGLRLSLFLSLQPGTGVMGLLTLMAGKGLGLSSSTRFWATVRMAAILLVPISGIVIMSESFNASHFFCLSRAFSACTNAVDWLLVCRP